MTTITQPYLTQSQSKNDQPSHSEPQSRLQVEPEVLLDDDEEEVEQIEQEEKANDLIKEEGPALRNIENPDSFSFLLRRFLERFGHGFIVAFSIKALFNLLGLLIRYRTRLSQIQVPFFSSLSNEPVRYGLFLGSVLATFETALRISRARKLFESSSATCPAANCNSASSFSSTNPSCPSIKQILLSGLLAGVGFRFLPTTLRPTVAIFLFLRSVEAWVRVFGRKYGSLLPAPLQAASSHLDVAVFSVATAHLLWAGLFQRDSIEPGYLAFVQHTCGKPRALVQLWAHMHGASNPAGLDPYPHALAQFQTEVMQTRWCAPCPPLVFSSPHILCQIMHPHSPSCLEAMRVFFRESLERSLRFYAPFYGVSLLLFRLRSLFKHPLHLIRSTLMHIGRSSLFMSTFCTSSWAFLCLLRNSGIQSRGWHCGLAGIVSGGCFLIESPHRRIELALYCTLQALQSFYIVHGPNGYRRLPRLPGFLDLLFAGSLATFFLAVIHHPGVIRSHYLHTTRFLFGESGAEIDIPQYSPVAPKSAASTARTTNDSIPINAPHDETI